MPHPTASESLPTRPLLGQQPITKHDAQTPLTEARKLDLGRELAAAVGEYNRLDAHLKDWVSRTKDAMKVQRKTITDTAEVLNQGFEMVSIACSQTMDFDRNTMELRRLDTGAILETRALTAEERLEAMQAAPKPLTRGATRAVPWSLDRSTHEE